MSFRRFSLFLCLPLAALICSLVYLGGDFPPDDYLLFPEEVAASFVEFDDSKSFDGGLPVVFLENTPNQHSHWVTLGFDHVSQGPILDLRATGPPTA